MTKKKVNTLSKVRLKEVSLVDRPAAPGARVVLAKRAPVVAKSFDEIAKGNPWHGPDGKFSSGPSSGGSPAYHKDGTGLVTDVHTGQLVSDPAILGKFKNARAPGAGDVPFGDGVGTDGYKQNKATGGSGATSSGPFSAQDFTNGKKGFFRAIQSAIGGMAANIANHATGTRLHVDVVPGGLNVHVLTANPNGGHNVWAIKQIPDSAFQSADGSTNRYYTAFRTYRNYGGTALTVRGFKSSVPTSTAAAAPTGPGVKLNTSGLGGQYKSHRNYNPPSDVQVSDAAAAKARKDAALARLSKSGTSHPLSDAEIQQRREAALSRWANRAGEGAAGALLLANTGRLARLGSSAAKTGVRVASSLSAASHGAVTGAINGMRAASGTGIAAVTRAGITGARAGAAAGRLLNAQQAASLLGRSKLGAIGLLGGTLAGYAALSGGLSHTSHAYFGKSWTEALHPRDHGKFAAALGQAVYSVAKKMKPAVDESKVRYAARVLGKVAGIAAGGISGLDDPGATIGEHAADHLVTSIYSLLHKDEADAQVAFLTQIAGEVFDRHQQGNI